MFAVVLGCVLCNLSTAAYLSERKRALTGTLQSRATQDRAGNAAQRNHKTGGTGAVNSNSAFTRSICYQYTTKH